MNMTCHPDVMRGGVVTDIGNRVDKRKLSGVKKTSGKRMKGEWRKVDNLHPDVVEP